MTKLERIENAMKTQMTDIQVGAIARLVDECKRVEGHRKEMLMRCICENMELYGFRLV